MNAFNMANIVSPVAVSIGIGEAWHKMVTERSPKACALASLAAMEKGHTDLMALADKCFDTSKAEISIGEAFIDARNIVARMQHRENSDEA